MSPSVQLNLQPMPLEPLRSSVRTTTNWLRTGRELFARALGKAGVSRKEAAMHMGISESQLSDQLTREAPTVAHLSFWRMFQLPPSFWLELILLLVEFWELTLGPSEQDRRDLETGRALRAVCERAVQR